jgi:H+-transporting ATPase
VQDKAGKTFQVSKGAPQVIMDLADLTAEDRTRADKVVNDFARQGFRALGVGIKQSAEKQWTFFQTS